MDPIHPQDTKKRTLIFLHGLESGPKGTKGVFFSSRYKEMIIPHLKGDLDERMKVLNRILEDKERIVLVGSSFGGLMATLFAITAPERCERLILLAPALNLLEAGVIPPTPLKVPTWIFHGTNDDVIPIESVKEIAAILFSNLRFYTVKDDHFLRNTFSHLEWDELLGVRNDMK